MKAIKCELCGNNQLVKQGDYFVCQFCGTKYAPEAAKKLLVAIDNSVSVNGINSIEDDIKNVEQLIRIGRMLEAERILEKLVSVAANRQEVWVAYAKFVYERYMDNHNSENYVKARSHSSIPTDVPNEFLYDFIQRCESCLNKLQLCYNATSGDSAESIRIIQEKVRNIKNDYEKKTLEKLYNVPNSFSYSGGQFFSFEDIYGQRQNYDDSETPLFGCVKSLRAECDEILSLLKNIGAMQGDSNGKTKRKKIIKYLCGESVYEEIKKKSSPPSYDISCLCGRTIEVDGGKYATLIKITRDNANEIFKKAMNEDVGGCYIATCVYGSYDCPEVWRLRRFRDRVLSKTGRGRLFIRTYYAISPKLVKWFGETVWFKRIWKAVIDRIGLDLKNKGFDDTPYIDE